MSNKKYVGLNVDGIEDNDTIVYSALVRHLF